MTPDIIETAAQELMIKTALPGGVSTEDFRQALTTIHQQGVLSERERIVTTVNEEAKRSFYVGKEMWRNDAYKAFRQRIFDVVFEKPCDIRPCQFACGYNMDWVKSNDEGNEYHVNWPAA